VLVLVHLLEGYLRVKDTYSDFSMGEVLCKEV
jgi:hypothetical protein